MLVGQTGVTTMDRRTITAFAVAPVVPPILYWVVKSAPVIAALPAIVIYGAMWSYPAALVVGLPAYYLITRYSRLRALHIVAVSILAGVATLGLMSPSVEGRTLIHGGLLGLSAGIAFWLLWRRSAAQPAVAAAGATRRR
jgi:hypothetical protein